MSSQVPAIRISHLSKRYCLGGPQEPYHTFRDAIVNSVKAPFKHFSSPESPQEFWALKDVSFDVEQGEVLGIIGRNGAGKSTLLKVLSRITAPNEGTVELHGRVGSLLEVGTGFHPELTGRENIYLSGSILGMKRREIDGKLDDIVKFSEIEKFLDTPVKRYSSGMYVRLAFAVAAHLDTEILLIDEVLAVGDAAFQKKCMGRMEDVSSKEGRTVLFVSHNMNAIEELCRSCILLEGGRIKNQGSSVRSIISSYLFENSSELGEWVNNDDILNNPWFKPLKFFFSDKDGKLVSMPVSNNEDVWITVIGEITNIDSALQVGYAIYDQSDSLLYWSCHTDSPVKNWPPLSKGKNTLRSKFPTRLLNQGKYRVEMIVALYSRQSICGCKNSPSINIIIQGGLSDSPYWMNQRQGILAPVLPWERVMEVNV